LKGAIKLGLTGETERNCFYSNGGSLNHNNPPIFIYGRIFLFGANYFGTL
jgi:hypothetical protein